MGLFANEARFFRFRVFFRACSLLNEVGDPPFFYISDITNLSTLSGKSLGKTSMLEIFARTSLSLSYRVQYVFLSKLVEATLGYLECKREPMCKYKLFLYACFLIYASSLYVFF